MIEVLKQMQKALREYHYYTIDAGLPNQSMLNKGYAAYQAGKQAIAKLESQEPVAWMDADGNISDNNDHKCFPIPLYTHPPQEPVDYEELAALGWQAIECGFCGGSARGYPQRTWVGLAKEDRLCAKYMQDAPEGIEAVIDYIETKLKEKNT